MSKVEKEIVVPTTLELHTDGGYRKGAAGWGFHAVDDTGVVHTGYGAGGEGTGISNNTAEVQAALNGYKYALDLDVKKINLFTDSEYVILGMNSIDKWKGNGFTKKDGTSLASPHLWKEMSDIKDRILAKEIECSFNWTRGHSGNEGNEAADRLATRGVLSQQKKMFDPVYEKLVKGKTETKVDYPDYNPMITGKRLFFKTNIEDIMKDGRFFYASATYEDKKEMDNKQAGKQASDTHYAFYVTRNAIPAFDKLKNMFNEAVETAIAPVLIKLDLVRKAEVWKELNIAPATYASMKGLLALTPNKETLGEIMSPPKLVFKMIDYFEHGRNLLLDYESKDKRIMAINVTDRFITTNSKGKQEIVDTFTQNDKSVTFPDVTLPNGSTVNVKLNVGIDMPNRNQLNNIIKSNAKDPITINVVLWSIGERSYHCGMIIECKDESCVYFTTEASYRLIG